jgi:Fe2+ transport system protein FeoA
MISLIGWLRRRREEHEAHEDGCTALCCARCGQCVTVSRLVGDAREAARLRDLGVREGATVTVLCDGDPLLIRVEDARFGIGRAAATHVLCRLNLDDQGVQEPN